MEFTRDGDEEILSGMETEEPVSPIGQYFNSSVLSICNNAVLEFEIPIDDSTTMSLLEDVFLPINPRFSSIMETDKNGVKQWRRVEVILKDHVKKPVFPSGLPLTSYDNHFNNYLSKISSQQLPKNRPLWEIHIIKYPTTKAACNVILRLHHALGDGYSLMGALLSCLQRADNPSLPLTFPSIHIRTNGHESMLDAGTSTMGVPNFFSKLFNSVYDFGWSLLKSSYIEDEKSPIRSGEDGAEFKAHTITTIAFSLDHIKLIKTKLKVTVNDVISGIIFFGVRSYMQESDHKSNNAHSTSLVLLNTRNVKGYKSVQEMLKPHTDGPWANQFTFLHVSIPKLTEAESEPLEFILEAHKVIKRKRNSIGIKLNGILLEVMRKFRGSEDTAKYIYSTLKNSSMAITNLVGPVEPMALANHPVKGLYFFMSGSPLNLEVTVLSYMGTLRICLGSKKGFIDSDKLKSCIENAFEITLKAAENIPS